MQPLPKVYLWFSEARVTYALKVLALVVLAAYVAGGILSFLARIETITIILIAAVFAAYILYPAVRALNARLPLVVSILIVYAALFALAGIFIFAVAPALSREVAQAVSGYPGFVKSIRHELYNPSSQAVAHVPEWLRYYVANIPAQGDAWIRAHHYDAAIGALAFLAGTLTAMAAMVIVPVLSAYILLDSESIKRYFVAMIPRAQRDQSLQILSELEEVLGGFIRGQLLVGASVGILISTMLLALHVPYALLIGLAAAILDIVPYIGAVITFIPAVLFALTHNGPANALIVAVLFIAIFELEGHLIAPFIVSKKVSLSPLTVILAILIGGELMGVVGMFIAVPVAGILRVLAMHVVPAKVSLEEAQPALTEAPRDETELAAS